MTEQPIPLRDQRWPEGTPPVVSIFCITYNHEKFIRDAIEGFLMQETTFPVEIFVHDDASKDGTQAILKEYQEKYPRLFRMVLQKENQWSRKGNTLFFKLLEHLPGEYVAICEGDDYWTSSAKLQKQIEGLKRRPDAVGSYHQVLAVRDGKKEVIYPETSHLKDLRLDNVVDEINVYTCSLCIRQNKNWEEMGWAKNLAMGDWPLVTQIASKGPLVPVPGILANYRLHEKGIWTGSRPLKRILETEKYYARAFKKFKKEITKHHRIKRKNNLLDAFKHAFNEEKPVIALQSLLKYLFAKPNRFSLPKKQKRAVLYALSFGLARVPKADHKGDKNKRSIL